MTSRKRSPWRRTVRKTFHFQKISHQLTREKVARTRSTMMVGRVPPMIMSHAVVGARDWKTARAG